MAGLQGPQTVCERKSLIGCTLLAQKALSS